MNVRHTNWTLAILVGVAVVAMGAPHSPQNRDPSSSTAPHAEHATGSAAPQPPQNRRLSRLSCPQPGQSMGPEDSRRPQHEE